MVWAMTIIVFAEAALLLDLGHRRFGSYSRTPLASSLGIVIVVGAGLVFGSPLLLLTVNPYSKLTQLVVAEPGATVRL